jgi:hypothetical protein
LLRCALRADARLRLPAQGLAGIGAAAYGAHVLLTDKARRGLVHRQRAALVRALRRSRARPRARS